MRGGHEEINFSGEHEPGSKGAAPFAMGTDIKRPYGATLATKEKGEGEQATRVNLIH